MDIAEPDLEKIIYNKLIYNINNKLIKMKIIKKLKLIVKNK